MLRDFQAALYIRKQTHIRLIGWMIFRLSVVVVVTETRLLPAVTLIHDPLDHKEREISREMPQHQHLELVSVQTKDHTSSYQLHTLSLGHITHQCGSVIVAMLMMSCFMYVYL